MVAKKKISVLTTSKIAKSNTHPALYPAIISMLFFVATLIGIIKHECWRDELQAWLLAINSNNIPDLLKNATYEGHPILWHSMLWIIAKFSHQLLAMQLLHILIATSTVFLINRYAPFKLYQKIIISFGYFFFYEYAILSRSYALGVFLVIVFCVIYKNNSKRLLFAGVILALLANTSIYGLGISIALAIFILTEQLLTINNKQFNKSIIPSFLIAASIAAIGMILAYWQIKPEPDINLPLSFPNGFELNRFLTISADIITSYFPIPKMHLYEWWNTKALWNEPYPSDPNLPFLAMASFLLVSIFSMQLLRKPAALVLYLLGTASAFLILYLTFIFHFQRFAGHLFIVLFASQWLFDKAQALSTKLALIDKTSFATKIASAIFIIIIFTQLISGLFAWNADRTQTFSNLERAGEYIAKNYKNEKMIFGSIDYTVSPLSLFINRPVYCPERKDSVTYMIWDKKKKWEFTLQECLADAIYQTNELGSILMVLSYPLSESNTGKPFTSGNLTLGIRMVLIKQFDHRVICKDEKYYFYHLQKELQ